MSSNLHSLKGIHRSKKNPKRLGRGPGSKKGKTSGRGEKGDGSRSGYKRRLGYEGGQFPLFKKLPIRGFTRGRFLKKPYELNLSIIEAFFEAGETVSLETLYEKGLTPKKKPSSLRILGNGELTKKVQIEAHHVTKGAKVKLEKADIPFTQISL